jgi:hypothetical protein
VASFFSQLANGFTKKKRRQISYWIDGKMAHDIPTVDHSVSSISELVRPEARVQLKFKGSAREHSGLWSAVGHPDRILKPSTLTYPMTSGRFFSEEKGV